MKNQGKEQETKSLLEAPSPHSTDSPVSQYGSLKGNKEGQLEPLIQLTNSNNNLEKTYQNQEEELLSSASASSDGEGGGRFGFGFSGSKNKKKRLLVLGGAVALVVAALVLGVSVVSIVKSHSGSKGSDGKAAKAADIASKSTNSVHKQRGYVSTPEHPLSVSHPVNDLGVRSFDRTSKLPNQDLFLLDKSIQQPLRVQKSYFGLRTIYEKETAPPIALPTNSWYQNLLLANGEPSEEQRVYPVPYVIDMVGPIPGLRLHHPIVQGGAKVIQLNQVLAHGLTLGAANRRSLLGSTSSSSSSTKELTKKFAITKMTPLGITLEWTDHTSYATNAKTPLTYSSSIVRGMPYATIQYNSNKQRASASEQDQQDQQLPVNEEQMLPTLASEIAIGAPPKIDGKHSLDCDSGSVSEPLIVKDEIELIFSQSDYTWLIFVSRPVRVQCIIPAKKAPPKFSPGQSAPSSGAAFALQFLDDQSASSSDLVLRIALMNDCTYGSNPMSCGKGQSNRNQTELGALLRQHKDLYPGPDSDLEFEFLTNSTTQETSAARMKFNWNVQSMTKGEIIDDTIDNTVEVLGRSRNSDAQSSSSSLSSSGDDDDDDEDDNTNLLMYALPHHQDMIETATASQKENHETSFPINAGGGRFCRWSLIGPVCMVKGSTWNLREDFEGRQLSSFRAPRQPQNDSIPTLAKALDNDLSFELPDYFQRGAGDTYFSGKQLAKLGRILTIGEELAEICDKDNKARPEECHGAGVTHTSDAKFQDALGRLRAGVEIWINGTADTPFVYDGKWGGLVSCGCNFDEKTNGCTNRYPDCVAFSDPGLNFGNAFYNDHHFHYGYHVYAAAIVAHFDPKWGRDHFEEVLLLVRDYANPSHEDTFFPTFRHKDWYQGSSWASGIAVSPLNGRNQESSSEAIAAYEAIALYGKEMRNAWKDIDTDKEKISKEIQNYGLLLTASELRSADRYWHVIEGNKRRQYPMEYEPHVIGIMWTTMAQFQTWFGNAAYLPYGIQMLPVTAVAEERDSIEWVRELYVPFAKSCEDNFYDCQSQGWSVLVLAMLATVGHRADAIEKAVALPSDVFESAGGNGHSLTNTIWYLSTRKELIDPLNINPSEKDIKHDATVERTNKTSVVRPSDTSDHKHEHGDKKKPSFDKNFDCGCPDTCNEEAMNRWAFGHTCRDRIVWLMTDAGREELDACQVVGMEFPGHCAACDPTRCSTDKELPNAKNCPPCSKEVCDSPLALCPVNNAPFLCTEGRSTGGCSRAPWTFENGLCESCCEQTLGCGQ